MTIINQCVSDDKDKKKEIREKALLKYQEKLTSDSRSKAEKQQAEKKYALETMMKVTYIMSVTHNEMTIGNLLCNLEGLTYCMF